MAYSGESSFGAGGGAPPSIWSSSLDAPATEELHRFCFFGPVVPLMAVGSRQNSYRFGPVATAEELRTHRGGRYNIHGRHIFCDGKSFDDVINHHR
ncbi:hypothetical protein ZWY2020_058732 [Hordeum vulgare]|nr:hypothetical protein ZWY2020_058732 [Hordeum vulgare]